HHLEQLIVRRLLVAGEQRLHVLPPTRDHERLERHVPPLGCPLPAVRMPAPALQARDTGVPFGDPELLTEDLARPGLVLPGAGQQPIIPYDAEPDAEAVELFRERPRDRDDALPTPLVELLPPPNARRIGLDIRPAQTPDRANARARRLGE